MKQFVKSAAVAVALVLSAFYQPVTAAVGPYAWYASINKPVKVGDTFTVEVNQRDAVDVISVSIENRGRKNLSVTLHDPTGNTIDNFFTGRKFIKMSRQYNFSGAEAGIYTIVISDGVEKITKQVKLEHVSAVAVNRLTVQ